MNDKIKTGQYDVVPYEVNGETSLQATMDDLTAGLSVEWTTLAEHGSGGGNPTVAVTGTPKDLAIFEARYNGDADIV